MQAERPGCTTVFYVSLYRWFHSSSGGSAIRSARSQPPPANNVYVPLRKRMVISGTVWLYTITVTASKNTVLVTYVPTNPCNIVILTSLAEGTVRRRTKRDIFLYIDQ